MRGVKEAARLIKSIRYADNILASATAGHPERAKKALLAEGRTIVVVRETGNYIGRLKERAPLMKIALRTRVATI